MFEAIFGLAFVSTVNSTVHREETESFALQNNQINDAKASSNTSKEKKEDVLWHSKTGAA